MVSGSDNQHVADRGTGQQWSGADHNELGEVFDAYALGLYDYAHGLLRDQLHAADALRDSLIAAQEQRAFLRQPDLYRAWLYALLRTECVRRISAPPGARHSPAPEVESPEELDEDELAQRDEARKVALSALAALGGEQREIVDLSIRHGLDDGEVAAALGLPTEDAEAIIDQAHEDLDKALAAVVVARTRAYECKKIAMHAEPWPLPPQQAVAVLRHVPACRGCRKRRPARIAAARMLALLPIAQMPDGLRSEITVMAADPDLVATRLRIARRVEPLDPDGWPLPPMTPGEPRRPERQRRLWPAVIMGGAVVIVGLIVMTGLPQGGGTVAQTPQANPTGVPSDGGSPDAGPTEGSGTSPSVAPTSHSPAPSRSAAPTATPSTRASRSIPPVTHTTSAPPVDGTLSTVGCVMSGGHSTCQITITAVGGAVDWRVSGVSGAHLSASGSGHLSSGESAMVTVSRSGGCTIFGGSGQGDVSFSPNGTGHVSWSC